jgi:hypothetical protein
MFDQNNGQCICNKTILFEDIKSDKSLREFLRGAPGQHGRDGKTGAPGLTVSS